MATNTSDFYSYSKSAGTAKNLSKPTVAGDTNVWGTSLNTDLDSIVAAVNAMSDLIADSAEKILIDFTATGSAINHIGITNAAAGNAPSIAAIGGDTNINLTLAPKGSGEVDISKVDIDSGAIDGTAIGASSHSTGKFTTCDATTDFTVGGMVLTDGQIADTGTLVIAATTATSFSDGNITHVGDINLDSVSVDDAAVGLDIIFGGNTTLNKISLTDNLADALNINQGGTSYLQIVTTNSGEKIIAGKDVVTESDGLAFKARWSSSNDNYSAVLGWADGGSDTAVLQLGNSSINEIRAGHVGTGGKFNFIVNNTAAWNATHDGTLAMTMNNDGDIYSTAWATFTPVGAGFSSTTINSAVWMRLGSNVFIKIDITGTSNANTFSIASLPHASAAGVWGVWVDYGEDGGNVAGSKMNGYIVGGTSTITMCLESNDTGWTTSGTKRAVVQSVYRAASW